MKDRICIKKIFIYSSSITISTIIVNIIFFTIVGLIGLLTNKEIVHYGTIIGAIIISIWCGFLCYKKISTYLIKEIENMKII